MGRRQNGVGEVEGGHSLGPRDPGMGEESGSGSYAGFKPLFLDPAAPIQDAAVCSDLGLLFIGLPTAYHRVQKEQKI